MPSPTQRTGSVLVIVLGVLFALSVLMTVFIERSVRELRYRALFIDRDELTVTAHSALEATLAALAEVAEIDEGLFAPVQGWREPLKQTGFTAPPGLEVRVEVRDKSGQIPFDKLDPTVLGLVLEQLEVSFGDQQRLIDTLLDWTDEDDLARINGAEAQFYASLPSPYRPRNARLRTWEELRLIEGWNRLFFDEFGEPNVLYERFTEMISLRHKGKVNLHAAPPAVLEVLGRLQGFEADFLIDYLNGLDGKAGTADDRLIATADNPYTRGGIPANPEDPPELAGVRAETLQIEVYVSRGDATHLLTALVDTTRAGQSGTSLQPPDSLAGEGGAMAPYPMRILGLREDRTF
jgi:general secretion pathway protein K